MGSREFGYGSPAEIMDEIAALTPSYGGIIYDRLRSGGLHWPCPSREHAGAPYLHKERFTRANGEFVLVQTCRGQIRIKVLVTERVPEGVIFIPFHFVECAANVLTNPAPDPKAKIPELKVCAAKLEKAKVKVS